MKYRVLENVWVGLSTFTVESSSDGKNWKEEMSFPSELSAIAAMQQLAHPTPPRVVAEIEA